MKLILLCGNEGINALILNYNANYYQSKQDGSAFNSFI